RGVVAAIAGGGGIEGGMGQADPPKQAEGKKEEVKPAQEGQDVQRDDPLPAGSTLRFGTSRFRHGESIGTMAVSADGKTAVVGAGTRVSGSTRAFDLVSGRPLFTLGTHAQITALPPDGQTLVTKQDDRLHVCDSRTRKELRSIVVARGNSPFEGNALAFTPDGKAIATASDGQGLHLIDIESGKTIRNFVHDNPESALSAGFPHVLVVAFSPDGKWMASGGYENDRENYFARLWDVEAGKEVRRFMLGRKGCGVRCLAFSPDGKTLATLCTHGGTILR